MNKTLHLNKYDLLFLGAVILFFFSENQIGIPAVDQVFSIAESFKLKYVYTLLCCVVFYLRFGFRKNKLFNKELIIYCFGIAVLGILSLCSIFLLDGKADIINELLYFLVPLFFAYCTINARNGDVGFCLEMIFWVVVIGFVLTNRNLLTVSNILSINFVDSYSPFEGEIAFFTILFLIYYLWKGKKVRTILAFVLCVLCFKRLMVVCAILTLFVFRWAASRRKVSGLLKWLLLIGLFCIPLVFELLFSNEFAKWFYFQTGMTLHTFTKGRFLRFELAFDSYKPFSGLGSLRLYLTEYLQDYYNRKDMIYDLHCDLVRFYLESGLAGYAVLLWAYLKNAFSPASFYLMVYIFVESSMNHMFGAGRTLYWVIVYLMIYLFNTEYVQRKSESCEALSKSV